MNTDLRQFALLQLEMLAQEVDSVRLWAAIYAIQAMDNGPRPTDWNDVILRARLLDENV